MVVYADGNEGNRYHELQLRARNWSLLRRPNEWQSVFNFQDQLLRLF